MLHSNMRSKLLTAMGAAILALALLAPMAQAKEPAAGYKQFAGCPTKTEKSTITSCIHAIVTGGHFQMGSKDVPITNPITITGGTNPAGEEFTFNSEGGLSKSPQEVPGGIIGLTGLDWLIKILNVEQLKLYATTELAGTPGSPVLDPFFLPIKVHLTNPVLGKSCYVGSTANPINLNMTFFTTEPLPPNEPITGKNTETEFDFETNILHLENGELVENEFGAPGASGCKLELPLLPPVNIDGLVNTVSGLPSPAGTNETRQETDAELVHVKFVYPPKGF